MKIPSAYAGSDPYVFVAYSHHDAETVHAEIDWLQREGFKVAYDEGITPGSSWSDAIAERIQRCECFIYFISNHSVASEYCRQELNFAIEEHRKVLAVHLAETTLPPGVRLSLNNRQAIARYAIDPDTYQRKLRAYLAGVSAPAVASRRNESRYLSIAVLPIETNTPMTNEMVSSLIRYLSWQGGIFRACDNEAQANYLIRVKVQEGQQINIRWEVVHRDSGNVVWANRFREHKEGFEHKHDHIAETIGEGAMQMISDFERSRIADQPLAKLTFAQLMLKAERLNYIGRDQIEERLAALTRARQLEPESALPSASLAGLLSWQIINGLSDRRVRDEEKLMQEARHALRVAANDPSVLLTIGTCYSRMGRYQDGLSLIRRACQLAPTVNAKDQLARSLCFAGQPDEAITLFEEVIRTMPAGLSFPHVRLAIALAQAGRLEDAIRHSELSVLNFPEDYYGWFVHANLLAQLGRQETALEAIREGQQLAPAIRLQTVIQNTVETYGRTEAQRCWLTDGLKILASHET